MATPNPLSYVNYDFDDLVTDLENRLKATDAWKDTYKSATGQMLIELNAYVANLVLFYVERRAEESYIDTAQNFSSVINLVKLINYLPKRKTSAVGSVTFTLSEALTKIVYIPKYIECQTANGTKFLTNEAVAILVGGTTISPSVIQGELVELEYISDGAVDQKYTIDDTNVENSADASNPSLRVTVDGVAWTSVTSFIGSINSSTHYRIISELDNNISIIFGNNIKGAAPVVGDVITFKYVKSDGIDGNVYSTDKVTTINDIIYDEDDVAVTTLLVSNASLILGGDDAEDIEEVKYEAPRVFATGERAVSKADFISILENYAGVANVNVWGENEVAAAAGTSVDYESLNKVFISIILQEWQIPDDAFKDTLSTYLYNLSMLTVKYEYDDPDIILVYPLLDVIVTAGYSLSETQTVIENELAAQFLLGSTTKLGQKMKFSNIISALDALVSVVYLTMVLEVYQVLNIDVDSSGDYGGTLLALDIIPESVKIYIGDTQVGVDSDNDNGTGVITDLDSTYAVSGSVNYTTGVIVVDLDPIPSEVVSVRYQQDEEGSIVSGFNEIAKLYNTNFNTIAAEN